MTNKIEELWIKAGGYHSSGNQHDWPEDKIFDMRAFAELIIKECIAVAQQQRNPASLNYKPSERFAEELQQHFGVEL